MIPIRHVLFFLLSLATVSIFGQTINVKKFGAKGDGITNDYPALKKIVDAVNAQKGGEIYFPPGVYYIGEFHDGKNDIGDLEFKNCTDLKISGSKAVISIKGDFRRSLTTQNSRYKFSNISAVIPFRINNCKNVVLKGLEIDGNVDKMTRDSGVIELGGHLIWISESENVSLINLLLHHAQTDALVITGATKPSVNVLAKNVTCANNGRQGMSIGFLEKGSFTDCKFINTGLTEGSYGNHAPSAGVDIEPNGNVYLVSDVAFTNCLFENNLGSQFVASTPNNSNNINFKYCQFRAENEDSRFAIIINAKDVTFENSTFDLNSSDIYPVWQQRGSSSVFRNCIIKSSSSGIVAVNNVIDNSAVIDSCTLEYTGKNRISSYFPYIRMENLVFTNNIIKIPEQYYKPKGPSGLIQNVKTVSGIDYSSNGKTTRPYISFDGSKLSKKTDEKDQKH